MPDRAASTIGVDLAAQPRTTGVCVLRWDTRPARVAMLHAGGVDDAAILDLVAGERPAKVGIDAPFGWPAAFVAAMVAYAADGRFPEVADGSQRLRLRATDVETLRLAGRPPPLSVSTDLIGVCAFRCARLLTALTDGPVDRSGSGLAVEVYPAAALRLWGLPASRYKGTTPDQATRRDGLVDAFRKATAGWLALDDAQDVAIRRSDHAFDALVAGIVARAQQRGRTLPIPDGAHDAARAEGWIHLPEPGSLSGLEL